MVNIIEEAKLNEQARVARRKAEIAKRPEMLRIDLENRKFNRELLVNARKALIDSGILLVLEDTVVNYRINHYDCLLYNGVDSYLGAFLIDVRAEQGIEITEISDVTERLPDVKLALTIERESDEIASRSYSHDPYNIYRVEIIYHTDKTLEFKGSKSQFLSQEQWSASDSGLLAQTLDQTLKSPFVQIVPGSYPVDDGESHNW